MALNVKIYKNTPLDKSYNDVMYFSQPANFVTWLNTYLDAEKNNLPQYFDGKNEIVLSTLYEDANYMLIYDTNSDNLEFAFSFSLFHFLPIDFLHHYLDFLQTPQD